MRIAFLGDSLTEGHPGESYLARLRRLLPGDELRNGGRAGDTIPALLARFEHTGLEPADLALVWIGVNDAFLGDWYLPDLDELLPPTTPRRPADPAARARPAIACGRSTTASSISSLHRRRSWSACRRSFPTRSTQRASQSASPALPR